MHDWRPSYQLAQVINGHMALEDASDAVRSAARLPLFNIAAEILKLPKQKRREAIDAHPPRLVPHIEAEIIRLAKP